MAESSSARRVLSDADLAAMADYLRSLPGADDAGRDAAPPRSSVVDERGAQLYVDHCADCHGETATAFRAPIRRWRTTARS